MNVAWALLMFEIGTGDARAAINVPTEAACEALYSNIWQNSPDLYHRCRLVNPDQSLLAHDDGWVAPKKPKPAPPPELLMAPRRRP